jgi:hypothetical protein
MDDAMNALAAGLKQTSDIIDMRKRNSADDSMLDSSDLDLGMDYPVPGPELDAVTAHNFANVMRVTADLADFGEQQKIIARDPKKMYVNSTLVPAILVSNHTMRDGAPNMFVEVMGGISSDERQRKRSNNGQSLADDKPRARKRVVLSEEKKMKERARKREYRAALSVEQRERERVRKRAYRAIMPEEKKIHERTRKRIYRLHMTDEQKERERIRKRDQRARQTDEQKEHERLRKRDARARALSEDREKCLKVRYTKI